LLAMEAFDTVAGELKRAQRFGVAGIYCGFDLGRGDPQGAGVKIEAVEFGRRLEQRRIAARGDVVDDGTGGGLDIGRYLALRGKEISESLGEIGAAVVEANGHGGFPAGPCSMARRQTAVNP
jgi:hypothetical protein